VNAVNAGHRPPHEIAVRLLRERFLNRTDQVAVMMPWDKPAPAEPVGCSLEDALRGHVVGPRGGTVKFRYRTKNGIGAMRGPCRIGIYAPAVDGTTKWLCLDFDGGADHADALADPTAAALAAVRAFAGAGLPAHLERSKSGKGWHLWCFFSEPISAGNARALGKRLAPSDAPLVAGGVADPERSHGIEIFPKQEKLRRRGGSTGLGNMVWAPWFYGASEGGNLFHRLSPAGELEPYAPEDLETASPAAVEAALAVIESSAREPREGADTPERESPASMATSSTASRADPDATDVDLSGLEQLWAETAAVVLQNADLADWKRRALDALRLEDVYGSWLTGEESGEGWLRCRDPGSASGDRDPSAGVATGKGEAERGSFHSFISGATLDVFDFLQRHSGCASFKDAAERIARLTGVPLPERKAAVPSAPRSPPQPAPPPQPPQSATARLPKIEVNGRQMRHVVADAWSALLRANAGNEPTVFQRAGHLVRLRRTDGEPRIEPMIEDVIYGHLLRSADWVRVSDLGESDATPPKDVSSDMLAFPDERLPELEGVVSTPIFDADGNLIATPGYHAAARLWFHERADFRLASPVPERPTESEVFESRQLLVEELLHDFPFVKHSDVAHAVAAILLPFARRLVSGCSPLHLLEAPSPGSGKGLLADVVAMVATGASCKPTTITDNEEETKKEITSILSMAPPVVLLDNVRGGLDSAQLAAAVTADPWMDRPFRENQRMIELPNKATWLVTANNPSLSLEMARRCIRVRIDAKTDRPWERPVTTFKHPKLREWVREHRVRLVHAVLTLIRAWLVAGRPPGTRSLGSFESWAAVVGGILEVALIPGFLADLEELYESADGESADWRAFCAAWWERFQGDQVKPGELLKLAQAKGLLAAVLGDRGERSQATRLGKALQRMRDRQFAEWRIATVSDTHAKAALYCLVPSSDSGGRG
jgi:hypothetical protein